MTELHAADGWQRRQEDKDLVQQFKEEAGDRFCPESHCQGHSHVLVSQELAYGREMEEWKPVWMLLWRCD